MLGERVGVLVAAAGAAWEVEALRELGAPSARTVVLKRCMDLADLLAAAATGQAPVAVVAAELPGLDTDSIGALRRSGVAVVSVTATPGALPNLPGVHDLLTVDAVGRLASAVEAAGTAAGAPAAAAAPLTAPLPVDEAGGEPTDAGGPGRIVAVWGPTGAPGRTTLAVNLAAELAARGDDTMLVDADCYGGAVAQHLGVLDEVSGLLSAVRSANSGQLDVVGLASAARTVAPRLRVLTGLPRADRWVEVRPAPFDSLLETARLLSRHVVLDLGFGLEQESGPYAGAAPQRNHMTVAGLEHADEVVVVGGADPVGLARLARGLVELPELVPATPTRVAVNRVRPSLGWGEHEVRAMVEGFVRPASMHLLPDEPDAVDRALVAGRPLREVQECGLTRELGRLADAVRGEGTGSKERRSLRLRRRRAGRAR